VDYDRLLAALKFKRDRNSTYFIVKSDFTDQTQNIRVYVGGMILFSDVITEDKDYVYMHVMYKTKPLSGDTTVSSDDEGLIKLKYADLASLIIARKVEAYYTDTNSRDKEIYDIINEKGMVSSES
jgi:hypothetical protein